MLEATADMSGGGDVSEEPPSIRASPCIRETAFLGFASIDDIDDTPAPILACMPALPKEELLETLISESLATRNARTCQKRCCKH